MTMMSRNSSDSSLDEQESTVSSKSGPRKSLESVISQNRRMRNRDCPSDSSDMPSLSSFRLDEMSASAASRGDSYASRGECDISLPSLSSFRMEDMSLASSYHSGTNHLSEESAEGWSSFTSGNVSADTDSEEEFATSSSAPGSERGEPSSGIPRPAPKSGILKANVSVDSVPDDNNNCNLMSNARPPRRRSPETEEMTSSLPMRRPRRTLSPMSNSRVDTSEKVQASGRDEEIPRPTRSASPDRAPVERTASLPLSVLKKPSRSAHGDSSSSLRTGDSSSSLRGGDSLPRLPRRTSTLDDRSSQVDEDVDDDTKESMEGSRVSDEESKMSYDDVTDVSDGDVSIASDLSDDSIVKRGPLHESDKVTQEKVNPQPEQILQSIKSIKSDSGTTRSMGETAESKEGVSDDSKPEKPTRDPDPAPPPDAQKRDSAQETSRASFPSRKESEPLVDSNIEGGPAEKASKPAETQNLPSDENNTSVKHEDAVSEPVGSAEPKNEQLEASKEAVTDSTSNATSKDGKGPVRNRKSPTSVRELEGALPAKEADDKVPDESGTTSAEESGTTASDTEVDESEEIRKRDGVKKEDVKRGLLRKMSNSFKNIGKSTSFRNSFRMIGRTASKLKSMGKREEG